MRWLLALSILIPAFLFTQAQGTCIVTRLAVSAEGQVTPGAANRMRDTPSTSGALIGEIPGGARFAVLDGPVCDGGILWWQVSYNGITGYTAEASGTSYFVEPVVAAAATSPAATAATITPVRGSCPFSSALKVGGLAYVNSTTPLRMRDQPSTQGREVRLIQNDQNMHVLEGPVCDGTYIWWRVTYKEATGWTIEGNTSGAFLTGIDPTATPTITTTPTPSATLPPTMTATLTLTPTVTLTPTMTPTPLPSAGEARDVAWSADGETLYLLGSERLVRFDMTDLSAFGVEIMANTQGAYMEMVPDGDVNDAFYLLTAQDIDYVTSDGQISEQVSGNATSLLRTSADGDVYGFIETQADDREYHVLIYERGEAVPLHDITLARQRTTRGAFAISPDGKLLAVSPFGDIGQTWKNISVLPITEGADTGYFPLIEAVLAVQELAFAHDSSYLVAASVRGDLERFTPDLRRAAAFIRADDTEGVLITRLVISPDDQFIAIVEYNATRQVSILRVYRADAMTEVLAYGGRPDQLFITDIAFSPDGSLLAAASGNGARLFNIATRQEAGMVWRVED